MAITIEPVRNPKVKSKLCRELAGKLPEWFGNRQANAYYAREIAYKDTFAACIGGTPHALIALTYHYDITCEIWWLAVSPDQHNRGLGTRLLARAEQEARDRGCKSMAVKTVSPRIDSPEYALTRLFYKKLGFEPYMDFEPQPDSLMLLMHRAL